MNLRATYLDWPHEVSIETFAKCNASCTFCPYTTLERIGTKMPDELIDAIIGELKDHPWPFIISPFKVNEPFLDKRLIPICQKINRELPKAHIRLFSNGSALTEKHIDAVNELEQVAHLWISLNDHRADEYKALMGLDFDHTAANLDVLHQKVEQGFRWPVVVSRVREAFIPSDNDRAFSEYVNRRWPLFKVHLIKPDSWLGDVKLGSDEIPDAPCGRWFELSVMATGEVSLCCMDGRGQYAIGDLNKNSLFEVYNAPHWRERRLKMLSRKGVFPCSTCSY